jgi:NACalpha-BTF3-like transcription factor
MVVAEKLENSEGIKNHNIEYLIKRYGMTRNEAVKTLRTTNGSVLDAFVKIENKK